MLVEVAVAVVVVVVVRDVDADDADCRPVCQKKKKNHKRPDRTIVMNVRRPLDSIPHILSHNALYSGGGGGGSGV